MDYESPRCNFNYRTRRQRDEQQGRDVAVLSEPLSIKAGLHLPPKPKEINTANIFF
jgi:hypothetical protein